MTERLSVTEWLRFDATRPAPTFFARPAWTLALCDASPALEPSPMRVRVDSRSYIVPAVRSPAKLGLTDLVAFPMGGYTCVLDEDGLPADAMTSSHVLHLIARGADRTHVVLWPLGAQAVLPAAHLKPYETAVIDCSGGYARALEGIRGVTRRMAGQAQRRGVTLRRADCAQASIDAYFAILSDASIGWGLARPPITKELLDAVVRRGGDDVEIWFADVDSEPVAGGVVLYGRDELFFWSAAMRRSHSQYRPSNALNLRLIEAACERGVRWYNLGASEGLSGVERFKADLGATSVPYTAYTLRSPRFHIYERIRRALH
ncbi:MAG: GNAT family N-acetyltransferase [Candidatus Baltobacteraceae bacterium]